MNNSITDLSASHLRQAADLKEKIDGLQHQLQKILGGSSQAAPTTRRMSPAAIARIRAAAKARWARIKGKASSKPAKHGRRMSAAARARLAAIARARWKKAKAAGKKAL